MNPFLFNIIYSFKEYYMRHVSLTSLSSLKSHTRATQSYQKLNALIFSKYLLMILATLIIHGLILTPSFARKKLDHPHKMNKKSQVMTMLRDKLIPPHLVMKHAADLNLTQAQKETLKTVLKKHKVDHVDHEFKKQDLVSQLKSMLNQEKWNEDEVLKRAKSLMTLNNDLKLRRLTLALKIRALLNTDQLKRAYEIKNKRIQKRKKNRVGRFKYEN
jgi:hypothetical protein